MGRGGSGGGGGRIAAQPVGRRLAFDPLLQMNFGVSLLLVGAGEFAAALVAGERLLARVRPDVSRQVVRAREAPHADPALERLLTRVDANVAGQLVRPGKPPVARVDRTGVGPLVNGRLARTHWIATGFDRNQADGSTAASTSALLLVDLREDFVSFAR